MRIRFSILPLALAAATCFAQQQPTQQDQAPPKDQASGQNQAPPKDQDKSTPPAAPEKKPSTADENPFPEDISKKAAQGDDAPSAAPDSPPRSSPDEKEPGYSSSRAGMKGPDPSSDTESNISDGAGGYILNPKLAAQDVKIGGFYLTAGNYKGAYARYKEATRVNPENADAVFGLAEAARGLKLTDEAADNYRVYLEAFPDGSKSKAARKALAELVPAAKK